MSKTSVTNYWYKDGGHCGSNCTTLVFKGDDTDDALKRRKKCGLEFANVYLDQFGDCDYFDITFKVEDITPEILKKLYAENSSTGASGPSQILVEMDKYRKKYDEMKKRHSDKISAIKRMNLSESKIKKLIADEKKIQSIEEDPELEKYMKYEANYQLKLDEIMKNKPSWIIKRKEDYFLLVDALIETPEKYEGDSIVDVKFAAQHFPEWDDNKLLTIVDIQPISNEKLELINEEDRQYDERIELLQKENSNKKSLTSEEWDKWHVDQAEKRKNKELELDVKSLVMSGGNSSSTVVTIPDMFTCPICTRERITLGDKIDAKLMINKDMKKGLKFPIVVKDFEYELETDYKIETKVETCKLPISITCEYGHSWHPCHFKDHQHRIFSGEGEVDIMNARCRCKCYWKNESIPPPWIALIKN